MWRPSHQVVSIAAREIPWFDLRVFVLVSALLIQPVLLIQSVGGQEPTASRSDMASTRVAEPTVWPDRSVPPHRVGMSAQGLDQITAYLQREVDQDHIAGAVGLVARHGEIVYFDAIGNQDIATVASQAAQAMTPNTLFRIASMTKPITSAGILTLVDDGVLSLEDPVAKYLPGFARMQVLEQTSGDSMAVQPASRAITIRDLLTHQSGLTYGWFGPAKLDEQYARLNAQDWFVPTNETIETRVDRLSQIPLAFEPGQNWSYGVSHDVLGRVIEVASGLPLRSFLYERIFRPLKMRDTHFHVPSSKRHRLAGLYTIDEDQRLMPVGSTPVQRGPLKFSSDFDESTKLESGGGGLVSTAGDYYRFLQMLMQQGEVEGVRVLSSDSVDMMTSHQIGDLSIPFDGHGDGYGFGVGVLTDRQLKSDVAAVGTYSWGGIFNTYFWCDPQNELVGILMTQLFPYDHLETRARFKQLVYEAIDDSGFAQAYRYVPGMEFANPHFNGRQLRVNSPNASTHAKYATRSEPRSSGLARVFIDEDLRQVRRASVVAGIWGGHPGTSGKRMVINGRREYRFPQVGAEDGHCTHQYLRFPLRPEDLVNGFNSIQFACDQGETFWGHFIVDDLKLEIGWRDDDERLRAMGLDGFDPHVLADVPVTSDGMTPVQISLPTEEIADEIVTQIQAVHYFGRYCGYDENGNLRQSDWHGMTKDGEPYGHLGTVREPPFELQWDTSMLPAQDGVQVRAIVDFGDVSAKVTSKDAETNRFASALATRLTYQTKPCPSFAIRSSAQQEDWPKWPSEVRLFLSQDLPQPFWSRAKRTKSCTIHVDVQPERIQEAQLHVVAWTGGAGGIEDYFTLNGHHLPIAEGSGHETTYSVLDVPVDWLREGKNEIRLLSDTEHHGIEIMTPGPGLMLRYTAAKPAGGEEPIDEPDASVSSRDGEVVQERFVRLSSAQDPSAGNIECYKIQTPAATYYLDKVGAGLSSLIDRDGNDWIGFHPEEGSGAGGEFRGFPNAVFKSSGSYFHAQNSGTDPCVTIVEEETPSRVVISAISSNGLWAGVYTFTPEACTFTLTRKPPEHNYWVLYEGTPGGSFDLSDWWMTATGKRHPMEESREGDIPAGSPLNQEWIAFGDTNADRMLMLLHHEDDSHEDRFYQMQQKMTVFGFGRSGMKKHLSSVPQSFSIGLVESTEVQAAREFTEKIQKVAGHVPVSDLNRSASTDAGVALAMERFALTVAGDPEQGERLFRTDLRTRCSTCHQVAGEGGQVGPDLTKIGGKFDRPHLIESLLQPSKQIVEGYRTSLILTKDDAFQAGIVKRRDEESVELVDQQNQVHHIAVADITAERTADVSLMPIGLADSLSPQEFADLVAYLETLRTKNNKFGAGVAGPVSLPEGFQVSTVTTRLSGATAMDVTPDGRVLICEQDGRLRVVQDGKLLPEPMLEIPVEHNWERGLIGVTVSADFPSHPYVYVVYVTDKPFTHHRVSRFRVDGNVADVASEEILLRGDDQSLFGGNVPAGHQGGAIHFGNDGMLYVGIGEQTAGTPAQRMDALQGKILRLAPNGEIPADNPFYETASGKYRSIWASGCRNPFTFAIRASDGKMLINDVGGKFEEINVGEAGANYGWPKIDHGPTDQDWVTGPLHIYPQASISGGDFAPEDSSWPDAFRDQYFFADFVHGWIKTIDPDAKPLVKSTAFASGLRRPVDVRFSPDGSLYVLLRNAWVVDDKFAGGTGSLLRIRYVEVGTEIKP